ncbi:MAG TPA: AAA family ATPase, partial [Pseudonocardia sp.]|nr:AAA family ATPase [Pseudonocardia sp.]
AALCDAVDRTTGGQGGVTFLVGEPGIGKSRLARLAAAHAEGQGLAVLRGRAVPTATPLAYRPLAEALCSAVRTGAGAGAPELEPFRPLLGVLVPEWRGGDPRVEDPVMALAEAVLRFLRVVAGSRGCLIVLEDLHWADPETLRIVEYLADNLATERVLCLATVRDEDPSAGLRLARVLHARRGSRLVALSRLTPREVAEMVASCLAADTVPDAVLDVAARAEGVPFLVEELLAVALASGALVADGGSWSVCTTVETAVPLTYADGMRRRVTDLGGHTRAVLLAAAVLGRRFDWSLLPAVTGLGRDDTLTALRGAVDARIISVDAREATFRFRHALSRDAVLGELLPPELAALSRRALDAVEAEHPELEDGWCELAAELAERAGDRPRAARLLLRAARRALGRGALASAEATLDRARDLLPVDDPAGLDLDECLSQVLSLAGKRDRAVEVSGPLLARLGNGPGAAGRRAEAHLRLARAAVAATHWDEAYELLERARAETAAAPDERLMARVTAVRAQAAIMHKRDDPLSLAQTALAAAERLHLPEVACEALEVLGRSRRADDLDAAEAAFARALALAETHGLTLWRARALHELGTIDMLRGGGVTRLEEARNLAVVQGALATAAVVDVQIAAALAVGDDPESAAVAARRSAELARRYGLHQTLASAVALEAHVHARAGRREEMQRCIREARSLAPDSPDVEVKISFAAAVLAFVQEDRAAARRHLEGAVARVSTSPGGDYAATPGGGVLALVRRLDGTRDDRDEPDEDSVHFVARAFRRYAGAVAAGHTGHTDLAVALLAAGDGTLGDHQWLRQLARRLVAEAALADGWGEPVPWLREALAFFDRRGEERIASACRSLLRKAGAAVPRRRGEQDVPGALRAIGVTSRELEVLSLLALGLANGEIAARLYLSPRTVERHVANLTVKANVRRRSELVAYAARTLSGRQRG